MCYSSETSKALKQEQHDYDRENGSVAFAVEHESHPPGFWVKNTETEQN